MARRELDLEQPLEQSLERRLAGRPHAQRWLVLSLSVLVLAGLFALAVVVGRMPPFDRWVTDPLFFKRCLVAHVNMALVAWFYSFLAALLLLLLPRTETPNALVRHSASIAALGVVLQMLGAGVPNAQPVLANYIPTIDHWLFQLGQLVFGAGVLASLCGPHLLPSRAAATTGRAPAAVHGLRAAAAALLLAALTFAVASARQPAGLGPEAHFELLVWGTGHVLQLACALAMVVVWLLLIESATGTPPVSSAGAAALFAVWVAPWAIAPLLASQGGAAAGARTGFTQLMQFGIAPGVCIFVVLCVGALRRARRDGRLAASALADPRIAGFVVSAVLSLLGFALGAAIRGSNTMVPAHYHASVGAVTVAFMTGCCVLLGALAPGAPRALRRAAAWQPPLYGGGMLLFAAGFALAGAHGMGRKLYGAEQATRGLAESIGLVVMGAGGFVAVAGGVLFLVIGGASVWRRSLRRRRVLAPTLAPVSLGGDA
ncbi:cbb3-type cytochrome c oxidase subunit I [Myxococcota bacterium]|nr:cbb3-type cytochrome c oxidase subunit I [Myxococcota bacterium]MCZ7620270.1 cbb3-type cytochrome c oxidase subunit I [Myxococcota bacterium]